MKIIIVLCLATTLLCRKVKETNPACILGEHRFTGIRLQHRRPARALLDSPELVLKECKYGQLKSEFVIAEQSQVFNTTHCVEEGRHCFRLARHQIYTDDGKLYYPTGTVVGAVYYQETPDSEIKPISPLVADSRISVSTVKVDDRRVVEVGILRSPDVLEKEYPRTKSWESFLSPYELYSNETNRISNANAR